MSIYQVSFSKKTPAFMNNIVNVSDLGCDTVIFIDRTTNLAAE